MFVTACVYVVLLFSNEVAVLKKTIFNAFATRIRGKHMYLHFLSYQILFQKMCKWRWGAGIYNIL